MSPKWPQGAPDSDEETPLLRDVHPLGKEIPLPVVQDPPLALVTTLRAHHLLLDQTLRKPGMFINLRYIPFFNDVYLSLSANFR